MDGVRYLLGWSILPLPLSVLLWAASAASPARSAPPPEKPADAQAAPPAPKPAAAPPQVPGPNRLRLNLQLQRGARFAAPGFAPPGAAGVPGDSEENVVFARDRDAEQLLKRARQYLEEKRFGEVARALGALVEAPEDFFFQPEANSPLHQSLKAEAQRLLGSMPRPLREAYELQFGAQAEQMLTQALADRDWTLLADVSRRFFHTAAGYRATYLLGVQHLDHDQPLAAALCLERLQHSQFATELEPLLSLQLAGAWIRAGQCEKSQQLLIETKRRFADKPLTVGGRTVTWFADDDRALTWIAEYVGAPVRDQSRAREDWTLYRGNASRTATTSGGAPLLDAEGECWWIRNTEEPGVERLIGQLRGTYQDANFTALPAFHPLAVDGVVLMRTVSTLLAVDFKTGKRLWNVPVDETWGEVTDLATAITQQGSSSQIVSQLDQRLWDDSTYGSLSSDGRYVFSIEDLNFNVAPGAMQPRMIVLPNGRRLPAPTGPRNFNRLAAHDIRTGKLKWELGGPRGQYELELAGAFFLGPPLPLGDLLYTLAEINGEIRLIALDARSGQVQWGQQLAVVELDVLQDPCRRFSGVSPSYSDGVLVCPTGSGAVVALDLTTRSLLWGYRYQNTAAAQNSVMGRRIGAVMMFAGRPRDETDRWMDGAALIANGRVIVTPIESGEIHCLNLLDGELVWKKPRGAMLYVAGVHGANVLVVGRDGLSAIKLADGEPAWPEPVALPSGGAPSGRGFLSGDRYYLPLSTAEVLAVDVREGRLVERARSRKGRVPGNLVCYRGLVISQNVEALETFYELATLKAQVTEALRANPQDAAALAQRGALALHDGDVKAAVADLRLSHQLAPSPHSRELLVDALFDGLAADFATYAGAGNELEALIRTPEERSRYLRLMAEGMERTGNHQAAFDLYARLADRELGPEQLERTAEGLRCRRDRWAQAGMAAMYNTLPADQRTDVDDQIEQRRQAASASPGPDDLKRFIRYFGFHPASLAARDELAGRLSAAGEWLSAELLWRQVLSGEPSELSRQASVRLAQAMVAAGRAQSAAYYCRRLQAELADQVCLDGKTGRAWVESFAADPAIRRALDAEDDWPVGRVEKVRDERQSPTARYFPAEYTGAGELYAGEMTIELSQDRQTLVGRDGNGLERWKASLGDPVLRSNLNPSVLQARSVGNLAVVSLGQQVLAIDTLATGPAGMARVLWTQELSEGIPGLANQVGVHVRQIELPWGQKRSLVSDGFGRAVGVLGPVAPGFFCFQRARELVAVDPLSGETLWIHGDIEPASEVFGDQEYLFVVGPNSQEALVLRALDGREVGRRAVAPFNQRVLAIGRRLVAWQAEAGKQVFRMFDTWSEQQVWRHEFPVTAKAYQLDQELLGVAEPQGRFVVIRLADGQLLLDAQIQAEPKLSDIYLLASRHRLLVLTNRPWSGNQDGISIQAVPGVLNNPLLSGTVYAFDRQTGKELWRTEIDKQGLTLDQPRELPVLVFASRIYERQPPQGGANAEPYTSVMCLDKRTGCVAYQERIRGHISMFELVADPPQHTVELKLLRHSVRMKFTDEPVDPNETADATTEVEPQKANDGEAKPVADDEAPRPAPAPKPQDQSALERAPVRLEVNG